ncbi:YcaO-like family protein, partial [Patescibacteria group bacterium]|nr:YcaO-like family protein [Patescibacteria group bacterium]
HLVPSDTSVFSWTTGRELISNKKAYIPAHLVFWNYCRDKNVLEPIVRQPNTNGAAGGFSYESAVVGGIHELLQRDAFLIHWLTKVAPVYVELDRVDYPKLSHMLDDVRAYNIEPHFLYLTVDHEIPIYACVLVTKEDGVRSKVSVGAGGGGTHEEAMFDALREAINVHRWVRLDAYRETRTVFDTKNYLPFRDLTMKKQEYRLRFWAQYEMFDKFSWFLGGKKRKLSTLLSEEKYARLSPKKELSRLLSFFRKKGKGYEVYVYKANESILRKVGYASVKVIVPELVPLYLDETYAPLASKRLSLLKPSLPDSKKRTYDDFYPWPHPFP